MDVPLRLYIVRYMCVFGVGGIALLLPIQSDAATRTIANGGGNWNSTSTWVEGAIPTASDDVVATVTSGNVTINAAAAARSVDLSNYTGTLTHNAGITLSIGTSTAGPSDNALIFSDAMTYTLGSRTTSTISFVSTSTTAQNINTANKHTASLTFNGSGGSWVLQNTLNMHSGATLSLTSGTLDANNYNVTIGRFTSTTSSTRTLRMGSGVWKLGGYNSGGNKIWWASSISTFTIDPGTAIVQLTYTGSLGTRGIQTSCGTGITLPHFQITGGTDQIFITNLCDPKSVDFTGFAGTIINDPGIGIGSFIKTKGDLTLSPTMSFDSNLVFNTFSFISTGSSVFTSNGLSLTGNEVSISNGTLRLADDLSAPRGITINSAATLDANGQDISVGGAWINNGGSFLAGSGTVSTQGTSMVIRGTSPTTFSRLHIGTTQQTSLGQHSTVTTALSVAAGSSVVFNGFTLTATNASVTNLGTLSQGTGSLRHPASFSLSPSTLTAGDTVTITLTDGDENTDASAQESFTVATNGEYVTLTETGNATGVFQGSIATANGSSVAGNGVVEQNDACTFSVAPHFIDAQDPSDDVWGSALVRITTASCAPTTGGGGTRAERRSAAPTVVPSDPKHSSACTAHAPLFTDVPSTSWFTKAVQQIARCNIISGYTDALGLPLHRFGPADHITVGQMIKIALLGAGHTLPALPSTPRNTTATDWSAPYIATAETLSLSSASLPVHKHATRGEVIHTFLQAFAVPLSVSSHPFTDVPAEHPQAAAIATAYALGVITGDTTADYHTTGTLRPDAPINRAEAAVLLHRLLQALDERTQ